MKKKWIAMLMFLLALAGVLSAQERTVTGTVRSKDDGVGISGVNVQVKGTLIGVVTGADGSYSIKVPGANSTLVFTFIGYATQEINIGKQLVVNVNLAPDVKKLEEVAKKDPFLGPLQGRVAGVQIRGARSDSRAYKAKRSKNFSPSGEMFYSPEPEQQPLEFNTEDYAGINENI
ncbi:MAG TPA: carboxypeptidase-like regulatory domain-containing protein, partial [Cyclobacteriaceae bacterium]|nr:carboxypeptidase-like regulatory domain-containing protein [Cyclobacteriaceae bacterium]